MNKEYISIDILIRLFGYEEPCNFNGWDLYTDCEYCENNCDNHDVKECWKNAIKEKGYLN